MFTGIVESVGRIRGVEGRNRGRRLTVEAPELAPELAPGASISVDGACLTVVEPGPTTFAVDVIGTTLSRTVAGTYREGSLVNLERALALGDRLEGHLVQGHVDGVGRVLETREEGTHLLLDVALPPEVWEG
ncbi:MAG: riboflavin synthase, partial [Gemmatimonadetes bacterium]|nr:riboflavin synthase [Gemmatimonadota bacterium]NIR77039.1 riboflavin synthase [Gemmatimonadota bacterium]NIT88484.1 riboflavin synthase [Gemmatimonadota bacterium]NIU32307.1 riboflavin synthase [Gemmatimonadota bacterium]NIU34454.1 riboflavin synthase [Gemmatimonadota bacterium]